MIGRRGFLKAIGVGVLGLSLAMRGPVQRFTLPPPTAIADADTGMAIRFIRNWDAAQSQQVDRIDVMYGWGQLQPQFAVRMTDAPSWVERLVSRFWA